MPEVWDKGDKIVKFARFACLDEFIFLFWCRQHKTVDEALKYINILREVLYLYRTQGNISAIAGLVGAMNIEELKKVADLMNQYEDLTLSILNQTINSLRSGITNLISQLGIWPDITKWTGYTQCPGLQLLISQINEFFSELTYNVEYLQFKYNYAKNFLQDAGRIDSVVNSKYLEVAIDILDYLADRVNVLCAPFR